jgi:hypothetical protein
LQAGGASVRLGDHLQGVREETILQPRLTLSEPGDTYEKEAERVADAVMRRSGSESTEEPEQDATADRIQRLCPRCRRRHRHGRPLDCEECEQELQRCLADEGGGETISYGVVQAAEEAREPGKPLSKRTRTFFENRMMGDFSGVRIHTGPKADQAARSVNAKAYTLGNDVVFRSGEYRPETRDGKRLLTHELTHVVQQRNADLGLAGPPVMALQRDDESQGVGVKSPAIEQSILQLGSVQAERVGRTLTSREIRTAQQVFGDSINYQRVRIAYDPVLTLSMTAGDTILFEPVHDEILIHELAHVWQYQHIGSEYISHSGREQVTSIVKSAVQEGITEATRSGAYEYELEPDKPLLAYGTEQQAMLAQTYYVHHYGGGAGLTPQEVAILDNRIDEFRSRSAPLESSSEQQMREYEQDLMGPTPGSIDSTGANQLIPLIEIRW